MNDLEAGYSLAPCLDTQSPSEEETPTPATVYGRQESDESYEGVLCREGDLRIVNCRDDIQWIAQQLTGGRWRNKSFHRMRRSLIQRYGPLEMILALPEHHDGFTEVAPRCEVCGRIKTKPTAGLPRHMFCIAMRKARNGPDSQEQPIMPGKGRPFPKGVSGNPGGRPKVLGDVQELARQKSPEAITPLANIMHDEKAPPAARVAAANALLDRGYGKPTQPISQTLAKTDPSSITDEELAAIAINGASVNVQAH